MNRLSLKFQLQKSRTLYMFLLFVHIGTIFCISFIPLVFWGKITLIICVLAHLIIALRFYALRNTYGAITELWQNSGNNWSLKTNSGHIEQAILSKPLFVSNYLIVLNFISTKKFFKTAVAITKDTIVEEDNFRKLKVLLKNTS